MMMMMMNTPLRGEDRRRQQQHAPSTISESTACPSRYRSLRRASARPMAARRPEMQTPPMESKTGLLVAWLTPMPTMAMSTPTQAPESSRSTASVVGSRTRRMCSQSVRCAGWEARSMWSVWERTLPSMRKEMPRTPQTSHVISSSCTVGLIRSWKLLRSETPAPSQKVPRAETRDQK